MSTKALMTILFVSLMSLSNPHSLFCQTDVTTDSIVIVKISDSTFGYLFPKNIAIEYLNMRKELVPRAFTMIDSLSLIVLKQDTARQVLQDQNEMLRNIIQNDSVAIVQLTTTLANTEQTLKKQKRRLSLWKLSAVGTGILGGIVGYMFGRAVD